MSQYARRLSKRLALITLFLSLQCIPPFSAMSSHAGYSNVVHTMKSLHIVGEKDPTLPLNLPDMYILGATTETLICMWSSAVLSQHALDLNPLDTEHRGSFKQFVHLC